MLVERHMSDEGWKTLGTGLSSDVQESGDFPDS